MKFVGIDYNILEVVKDLKMSTVVSEKELQQEEKADIKPALNTRGFLREVKEEFLKISWPSREQVIREFFAVLILVSVITGIIFVLDKVFGIVVNFFTGRLY